MRIGILWWPRTESRASEARHPPAKRSLTANCRHLDFQFVRMVCTGLSSSAHHRQIPATRLESEVPPNSVHVHQYPTAGLQRGYTTHECKGCEASRMKRIPASDLRPRVFCPGAATAHRQHGQFRLQGTRSAVARSLSCGRTLAI